MTLRPNGLPERLLKITHEEVPLASPHLKDEEWADQVRCCLRDPTRTLAANEIPHSDRPSLAVSTTQSYKTAFIEAVKALDQFAPLSKIQHLIDVLGAARLLEEIILDSLFTLDLPNTNKVALVVPLSHWTYCEQLPKSELPTYGCFSLGAEISSREKEIPRWNLSDLLDRASKRGKGQQEVLLALVYKGAGQHLALKAQGATTWFKKCASNGVVTSGEKYTVARSEHCTIKSVIVVWGDLTFIRNQLNQSQSYDSTAPKEDPKDDHDDRPPDPDHRRMRSWDQAGYGERSDDDA
eukprot:s4608_g5.t1